MLKELWDKERSLVMVNHIQPEVRGFESYVTIDKRPRRAVGEALNEAGVAARVYNSVYATGSGNTYVAPVFSDANTAAASRRWVGGESDSPSDSDPVRSSTRYADVLLANINVAMRFPLTSTVFPTDVIDDLIDGAINDTILEARLSVHDDASYVLHVRLGELGQTRMIQRRVEMGFAIIDDAINDFVQSNIPHMRERARAEQERRRVHSVFEARATGSSPHQARNDYPWEQYQSLVAPRRDEMGSAISPGDVVGHVVAPPAPTVPDASPIDAAETSPDAHTDTSSQPNSMPEELSLGVWAQLREYMGSVQARASRRSDTGSDRAYDAPHSPAQEGTDSSRDSDA